MMSAISFDMSNVISGRVFTAGCSSKAFLLIIVCLNVTLVYLLPFLFFVFMVIDVSIAGYIRRPNRTSVRAFARGVRSDHLRIV